MNFAPIRPTWSKSMVEQRLIEAVKVIDRTTEWPMKIRTRSSDVPEYIRTDEDRMDILRAMHERLKLEGYYDPKTGLLVKAVPLSWGKGLPPTNTIQRAEEAFWWPVSYVPDEVSRLCLVTFIFHRARRSHGFTSTLRRRLRQANLAPIDQGDCYYRKNKALAQIAAKLDEARVPIVEMDEAA
jgi:hypothetical protein